MLPIGLLMREHRRIERMVEGLRGERESVRRGVVDPVFIDNAVDFFRTYADRTHHGKEEDILFRELAKKALSDEYKRVMDELVEEHVTARRTVRSLLEAKNRLVKGHIGSLKDIEQLLGQLIELYPAHIEKEDRRFFYPVMDYFSPGERDVMLREFYEFDRNMIHERYGGLVEKIRAQADVGGLMRCTVCGYIYHPVRGDPEHGVAAGARFDGLPEGWVCPMCFAPKKMFEKFL